MKIACTGGGTGGHIFPGIAVIDELKRLEDAIEVVWIGSGKELERGITSRFGIPYYAVPAGKLRRYFSIQNVFDVFKIAAGIAYSIILLKRLKIELLFSKGGYVAVGPVLAAWILRIPVITHESDCDPGLATRIISRFAETILLPYERTRVEHFGSSVKDVRVTGNPVRGELFRASGERGRNILHIGPEKSLVLVLGGSQGARQINRLIGEIRDELLDEAAVVHQMGSLDFVSSETDNYITAPFFDSEFPDILAAADLVISRAGAGTVWENGVLAKASILIPLGSGSSRGDQLRNAGLFEEEGAAVMLSGQDANGRELLKQSRTLLRDPEAMNRMKRNAARICNPDAGEKIARIIIERVRSVKRGVPQ